MSHLHLWLLQGHDCTQTLPTRVAAFPVLPSATGWASIGRPASSTRTLTIRGLGLKALNGPPSGGRVREGVFPPLAIPVADEGEFTHVTTGSNKCFVPNCVRPSDVARGLTGTRLLWSEAVVPYSQPILNRLGCVFPNVPVIHGRPLPYALNLTTTSAAHRLSSTLFSQLSTDNFLSKLTQPYRNSARSNNTSYCYASAGRKRSGRGVPPRLGGGVLDQ